MIVHRQVQGTAKIFRKGCEKDAGYLFKVLKFTTGKAMYSYDHVQAAQIVSIQKGEKMKHINKFRALILSMALVFEIGRAHV